MRRDIDTDVSGVREVRRTLDGAAIAAHAWLGAARPRLDPVPAAVAAAFDDRR
jgi:hypothetical protein